MTIIVVFINIKNDESKYIPVVSKLGFLFHRVNQNDNSLEMLIKFNDYPLPSQYTHCCGGFALILSRDFKRVFLVKERIEIIQDTWHPPGGKIEKSEFILEGTQREVFEETKIKGNIHGPVCLIESFPNLWEGSGMYFLSIMITDSDHFEIDSIELRDAKWFSITEYLSFNYDSEFYRTFSRVLKHIVDNKIVTEKELEKLVPFFSKIEEKESTRGNKVEFHLPKFMQ